MTTDPVDQLSEVLDATGQLTAAVREDQWAAPTPCTEWTVRDLVNHVVAGNRIFAAILHGEQPADVRRRWSGDQLGADSADAYRDAADEVLAAFRQPGVLDRVFTLPIGSVPGSVALHVRTTEVLVHGWDLARATGQHTPFPDDVVEQELAFTLSKLPDAPASSFAPSQPVSDEAPAIDRLAACLGRLVTDPNDA